MEDQGNRALIKWSDYCSAESAEIETDLAARRTEYVYDALGRRRAVYALDGANVLTREYVDYLRPSDSPAEFDTITIDALGRKTATRVDSLGRPMLIVAPASETSTTNATWTSPVTVYSYDFVPSRRLTVTTVLQTLGAPWSLGAPPTAARDLPEIVQTRQYLDPQGQSFLVETAMGAISSSNFTRDSSTERDALGRVRQATDRNGTTTTFEYDDGDSGTGGVSRQSTPELPEVLFRYDSAGHKVQQFNGHLAAHPNPYRWTYDALGRVTSEDIQILSLTSTPPSIQPVARTWTYAGTETRFTNRKDQRVVTKVDYASRTQTTTSYWSGAAESHAESFDQAIVELFSDGTPKSAANEVKLLAPSSSRASFTYDALGFRRRTTSEYSTLPNRQFLFVDDYDAAGRVTDQQVDVTTPSGSSGGVHYFSHYGYDDADRLNWAGQDGSSARYKSVDYVYGSYGAGLGGKRTGLYRYDSTSGNHVIRTIYEYWSQEVYGYKLISIANSRPGQNVEISHYRYAYDDRGRVAHATTEVNGAVRHDEALNLTFDGGDQVLSSGPSQTAPPTTTFTYDLYGNRVGAADPYNRLRSDANNRFDYDQEGNVIRRWALSSSPPLTAQATGNSSSTVTLSSNEISLESQTGWQRLRFEPIAFPATSVSLPVRVTYALYDNDSLIFSDTELTVPRTVIVGTSQAKPGAPYTLTLPDQDFFLASDKDHVYVNVKLEFPQGAPPPTAMALKAYVDRYDDVYEYVWDPYQRLIAARQYGPLEVWNGIPSPNLGAAASPPIEYRLAYDVFGQLIEKRKFYGGNPNSQSVWKYVSQDGRRALEFDELGQLRRQYWYAGPTGELLSIEETQPGTSTAAHDVFWAMNDRQGSLRDLLAVPAFGTSPPRHAAYEVFGGLKSSSSDLSVGYLGMIWIADLQLYLAGDRMYEPRSGRYLTVDPAALQSPRQNGYLFAENTPVGRDGAAVGTGGLDTTVGTAPRGSGSDPSYWDAFATSYSRAVNPVNQWKDGNYAMAVGQGLGWFAAAPLAIYLAPKAIATGALFGLNYHLLLNNAKALDALRKGQEIDPNTLITSEQWRRDAATHTAYGAAAGAVFGVGAAVLPSWATTTAAVGLGVPGVYDQGSAALAAYREGDYFQAAFHSLNVAIVVAPAAARGGNAIARSNAARYLTGVGRAMTRLGGGAASGVAPKGVPRTLEGLQARIDTYVRRAELRAWEKGLSGTEAGSYADRYLSKATYQLNRSLEQSGSQYRVLSEYGRDAFGQEFFGSNRPTDTRFLDVALTNTDRTVVYSGWDARFQSTPYARWNTNSTNADYVRYFDIQEGFVREISVEAARP